MRVYNPHAVHVAYVKTTDPKARPAVTPQIPLSTADVAGRIREIEEARSARDRYLEHARTNEREAAIQRERDHNMTRDLVKLVDPRPSATIAVDGVLYEITRDGVELVDSRFLS
ncbi:hypothetical protein U8335_03965 [Roseiconus lacunae]|uniref:hypothetical protein n=1 Tax=Roseiconus lacunae TaxID=2605694 RepID=UPI00309194DD|nr:hypothetical protein U8335_03965 [Stieleria sp. HD01]